MSHEQSIGEPYEPTEKRCIWVVGKYATAREQGFETRTVALAREWVRFGRDVVIITSNSNHFMRHSQQILRRSNQVYDGVQMVVLRTLAYEKTASIRRVLSWLHFEWRVLRENLDDLQHPDIIVVTSLSLFSVLNGIRLAQKHRCPWVFEVRDIWPLTLTEEGGVSPNHPFVHVMKWVERLGYRSADLTVGTMPNLAPHASRIAGRNIKCGCIPFGFDPALAPPLTTSDLAPEMKISRQGALLIVGYAGSIGVSNALDHFVEAAAMLRDDSRFRFVLLGDGDLRESFEARTSDCPNVSWLGGVERSQVHDVLQQCDLLYFAAHPSKVWDSGMSMNKLTDYLLAAKPVLGSYSGFPSILNESGCGEFVPAADTQALVKGLVHFYEMDPGKRAKMGEAGRDWLFSNRTWETLAADYLQLLDSLPSRA